MEPQSGNSLSAAVLDASVLVGFSAKESNKFEPIRAKLEDYAAKGWTLFAPGIAVAEVLYVLCKKRTEQGMPEDDYQAAIDVFATLMEVVHPPPEGDSALIPRMRRIHGGYGCSRMSDSMYLALAERLQMNGQAELVTTDRGMKTHAQTKAPTVAVELLPVGPN